MIENDKTTPTAKKINKRFWFILGLISVFALGLVISYNQVENTEKTDKKLQTSLAVSILYRQINGYPQACADSGYTMNEFSQKFVKRYQSEINQIKNAALNYNYTLEELFSDLDNNSEIRNQMVDEIKIELEQVRRQIILSALREHSGQAEPEWSDDFDNLLTMAELCQMLDKEPDDYFSAFDANTLPQLKNIISEL